MTSPSPRERGGTGDPPAAHDAMLARIVSRPGVVVLLGGLDTGKTTFARRLLRAAADAGIRSLWLDSDLGQSSVGPPTTVGLRRVDTPAAVDTPARPDELFFVGDVTPSKNPTTVLAQVARALQAARGAANLIVLDTSSYLAGITAERLKFSKLELAVPAHVVGLQRGQELEPLLTIARRFTEADVAALAPDPQVRARSPERRATYRRDRLAEAFAGSLRRFSVPREVFAPSLPPRMDLAALDGLLVGVDDGSGRCLGLGRLDHDEAGLHLLTPVREPPRGLRLGGVRLDDNWRPREISLRGLLAAV